MLGERHSVVDGGRLEPVVAEDLLHRRHADVLLQGGGGEGVAEYLRGDVLGEARPIGDLLDQALGPPRPEGWARGESPGPARLPESILPPA
jgi:hypothetical protein